jgi:uncharacterized protein DUF6754
MLATLLALQLHVTAPPAEVALAPEPNDIGTHISLSFKQPIGSSHILVFRRIGEPAGPGDWTFVKSLDSSPFVDEVPDPDAAYSYALIALGADGPAPPVVVGPERPVAGWFDHRRTFLLTVVVGMLALMGTYLARARKSRQMYVRRIPGIDAMEEAIGRATEMGRPILYIPGIEEIQDIQTIAGLLILGHVAEVAARYETELRVACAIPLVMVVAEETVRQGYYNAGRPEAHRPQNVQFISSEQFAFTAGANGIIMRERPATCIYMGRFYGESLVLAETAFVNGSIQIAGTGELTQLPFFIAACDYTIIGEELFAVSAYLSRDPRELSSLKATDMVKLAVLALIIVGTVLNTLGIWDIASWVTP